MKTVKHSKQRDCILACLMSRKDHPTAEMIYTSVKETFPNISLGTVYRNLTLLADQGEIRKMAGIGDSERFDGNVDKHYHFVCGRCGCVEDLEMFPLDHINVIAGEKFRGRIDEHMVLFSGLCQNCLKETE